MRGGNTGVSRDVAVERFSRLMQQRRWAQAEKLGRQLAMRDPRNHWLWARLASVRYQRRNYAAALEDAAKALKLKPKCSLAVWEKAEALYMLGRYDDAARAYRVITKRGVHNVLSHMCNEGKAWTRSLVADSFYRLARSYARKGKYLRALQAVESSLKLRGRGIRSLFRIGELRDVERWLREKASGTPASHG